MNKLELTHAGGFPFTQGALGFIQDAYGIFDSYSSLVGQGCYILQGCHKIGEEIGDGIVIYDGELLPFKRSKDKGFGVGIFSEEIKDTFEDGRVKRIGQKWYAGFIQDDYYEDHGQEIPEWDCFKRIDMFSMVSLSQRLEKMERKLNNADRPANEIPKGWVEHIPLRGRMPVGCDLEYRRYYEEYAEGYEDDYKLDKKGHNGGEMSVALGKDEIPEHNHNAYDISKMKKVKLHKWTDQDIDESKLDDRVNFKETRDVIVVPVPSAENTPKDVGEGYAHNNMPPYRVVEFIRFVGFDND